jgi:hypothetical protein
MDYYDSRSTSGVLYSVLERCIEDVLSFIKPLESDRNKRLNAIGEIVSSVQSIGTLKGRQLLFFLSTSGTTILLQKYLTI